jgi:hypothetical protein
MMGERKKEEGKIRKEREGKRDVRKEEGKI